MQLQFFDTFFKSFNFVLLMTTNRKWIFIYIHNINLKIVDVLKVTSYWLDDDASLTFEFNFLFDWLDNWLNDRCVMLRFETLDLVVVLKLNMDDFRLLFRSIWLKRLRSISREVVGSLAGGISIKLPVTSNELHAFIDIFSSFCLFY